MVRKTKRTGRITAIVQKSGGGGGGGRSKAKGPPVKKSSGTASGQSAVGKWKRFIKVNASGGMVLDKTALENARNAAANAAKKKVVKKVAKPKSAGGGGGEPAWKSDPNDSRNQLPDPSIIEEQNRIRNQLAAPQTHQISNQQQQGFNQMPQSQMHANHMQQNYVQTMFNGPPADTNYAYGMMDYPQVQPDYYENPQVMPVATRGGEDWRRPNQNQLGVITPDEFVDKKNTAPEPEEGFLGFFSTLSTEEMIALACGGAGFLLFIIVIIVIVFKLRKKAQRKKKKGKDSDRAAWVNRAASNASNAGPPTGFMQQNYRTLPGEKDPEHIARIQARNLPAPPLSYTQSAGVTGITTASGTYISDSNERPSMRHKD